MGPSHAYPMKVAIMAGLLNAICTYGCEESRGPLARIYLYILLYLCAGEYVPLCAFLPFGVTINQAITARNGATPFTTFALLRCCWLAEWILAMKSSSWFWTESWFLSSFIALLQFMQVIRILNENLFEYFLLRCSFILVWLRLIKFSLAISSDNSLENSVAISEYNCFKNLIYF